MRVGAIDYIAKPFDHDELLLIIERSLMQNRMRAQNQSLKQDLKRLVPAENLSHCRGMSHTVEKLVALQDSTRFVALHGECGTGKELLARVTHAHSERCDAPFVVADLPSIPIARMSVALLGGEAPKPDEQFMPGGLLHAAHNGTLVIRHPCVLPQDVQLALAKVLDERSLPGSDGSRSINVRTILISESHLDKQIESGELQSNLANLFNDSEFNTPALREIPEDIITLAEHIQTNSKVWLSALYFLLPIPKSVHLNLA